MERNLGSPLISPRGLAADHCMSRLWPLLFSRSARSSKMRTMKTCCSPRCLFTW